MKLLMKLRVIYKELLCLEGPHPESTGSLLNRKWHLLVNGYSGGTYWRQINIIRSRVRSYKLVF